jgi:hypothetical protein
VGSCHDDCCQGASCDFSGGAKASHAVSRQYRERYDSVQWDKGARVKKGERFIKKY